MVITNPRVLASLEPWAEISERLRRIFKLDRHSKTTAGGVSVAAHERRFFVVNFGLYF